MATNPLNGVAFGHEKTADECLARAAWELEQATKLRSSKTVGREALIAAHERTAQAYETLARSRGSKKPVTIPAIGGWNKFAGGSAAAPGKYSYTLNVTEGEYHIDPVSGADGKHRGYHLKFAARQQPRGGHAGTWHDLGTHQSPAAAVTAARKHFAASY